MDLEPRQSRYHKCPRLKLKFRNNLFILYVLCIFIASLYEVIIIIANQCLSIGLMSPSHHLDGWIAMSNFNVVSVNWLLPVANHGQVEKISPLETTLESN